MVKMIILGDDHPERRQNEVLPETTFELWMHDVLLTCIGILDRADRNADGNSTLLRNEDFDDLRATLVNAAEKAKEQHYG